MTASELEEFIHDYARHLTLEAAVALARLNGFRLRVRLIEEDEGGKE